MELFYPLIDLLTRKKNLTEQEFLSKYHQNDFDFRNRRFLNIDLGRFHLSQFQLTGADLRFVRNLSTARLVGANFTKCDLRGHNFCGKNLSNTVFHKARLQHTNFSGAICLNTNFSHANFHKANCTGTIFTGANLSHAQFNRANLSTARFDYANLSKAEISWGNISCCDFSNANLAKLRLWGNTIGAVNFANTSLDSRQMRQAQRDLKPIVSPGMSLLELIFGKY